MKRTDGPLRERLEARKLPGPLIVMLWPLSAIVPRSGRPAGTLSGMNEVGAARSVRCPVIFELLKKVKLVAVASPLIMALLESVRGPLLKTSPCGPRVPVLGSYLSVRGDWPLLTAEVPPSRWWNAEDR